MPKSVFTDAYASFLEVLVTARREAGVTQAELAKRLGRRQPFISLLETGERRIDLIEFYAIARAIDEDPKELFGRAIKSFPKRMQI